MGLTVKAINDRPWRSLGSAICLKAVRDYIRLRKYHKTSTNGCNLIELENFFKSDDFVLYSGGLNGHAVWERLESMYYNGELDNVEIMVKKSKEEREKGAD